jgi:N-acetylglutamate synthase-like GNAT family acetyltransferase
VRKQAAEGNPVLIRPAHVDEAEAIAALIHRAFRQYRGQLQPDSSALSESADSIRSAILTGTILVATQAGPIAGCVSVQRKADFAYAGRLAVDPLARSAGLGRALMAQAEVLAREMGADRLRVDVRLALTENRAFFRALGFVEGSHRRHAGFPHPTYVELEKTLI